jgi:hypothetical protein
VVCCGGGGFWCCTGGYGRQNRGGGFWWRRVWRIEVAGWLFWQAWMWVLVVYCTGGYGCQHRGGGLAVLAGIDAGIKGEEIFFCG